MLTATRTLPRKPTRSAVERANYDLSNAAGWLFEAIEAKMREFIEAPTADLMTVTNCIDYLESRIRVLHLVNRELRKD